jgi:protein-L-isoaspartate(D-aspartate) O-methyltransferase
VAFDARELTAYQESRRRLIERLRQDGITDLAVLEAFDRVPRHLFVPERFQARAYTDEALPLGHGQTISRPSTHALYLQSLRLTGSERALEVGTGSGFQTALLAYLCDHVFSVELVPELASAARARIEALGLTHVAVRAGDGRFGWRKYAPYDAILVTAGAREVPEALVDQLAPGGRLLIPVGDESSQALHRIERTADGGVEDEIIARVRFVDFKQLGGPEESGEEVTPW